jgi:Outer membrane receptor proteins, mostly Fe transport
MSSQKKSRTTIGERNVTRLNVGSLLATTAALVCLASPSFAQSGDPVVDPAAANPAVQPSLADVPVENEGLGADIVVTARKTAENLQSTPIAVSAFSGAMLEDASIENIEDITQMTPSFQAAPAPNNSGTPLISIRGLLSNEFAPNFDPSVGVYLDGVYAGTTIGALISNFVDVERVEILRGPQGTLYGRNTTGGAYNVYTKSPTNRLEGEIGARYGNFDRKELWGVLNLPIAEGAALRIVGSVLDNDGYGRDTRNDRPVADLNSRMLRGALKLDPGADTEIVIRADWQKGRSNGPLMKLAALRPNSNAHRELARELFGVENATTLAAALAAQQAHAQGSPFDTAYTLPTSDSNEIWGVSGTITHNLGNFQLKSITAFRASDATSNAMRSPLAQVTYNEQTNGADQFTQELQLTGDLMNDRLQVVAGLYYFDQSGYEISTFYQFPRLGTVPTLFYDMNSYAKSYAAYGQATFGLTDTVHVTGGLRYTNEKKRVVTRNRNLTADVCVLPPILLTGGVCELDRSLSFTDVAYTASIDWQVAPRVLFYARTSNGFKSGGLPHRVSLDPQTSDPFLPEDVTDYEIGMKSTFLDNRLRLNLAAYYADYTNIQRTVLTPGFSPGSPPTTATKNAASAKIKGLEAELSAAPVDNLVLAATLAYTDAHYTEFLSLGVDQSNQLFQNIPKWTYSLSAAYTVPLAVGDLKAQVNWYWRSKADMFPAGGAINPQRIQDSYGLLSGRLALELNDPEITIALWGKNLTDKVYFNAAFDNYATAGTINQYIAEPRTYGVEVSFRF